MMDHTIMLFLASVLIIGGLLFAIMTITRKGPKALDVEKYRTKWMSIEQQLNRDEISTYHLGVINADKLLDQALTDRAFSGKTMAERLKSAKTKLSNDRAVWSAHKLRNKLSHDVNAKVTIDAARTALSAYKQALKDVGAI